MRIGVLTTSYPRAPADLAGRFVAELDAWLAGRGCELEVLTPAPACSEHPAVRVVPIHYARHPRLFGGGGAPDQLLGGRVAERAAAWSQAPGFIARLAVACRALSLSLDALISHWLVPSGVVAARAGRRLPHLAIAHATDVHLLERMPRTMAAAALIGLARPRTRLVLTREALRGPLLRRAPTFVRPLIEGALVQRMGVDARPSRAPRRVKTRPRIVFVGRLVRLKGLRILLDAIAGLDVELIIAGEGPERAQLEAIARRSGVEVRFVGVVGGEHKRELLASADLFVLPSIHLADGRTDGAPVTLIEAMAAGACVVASRVGDVADVAPHGDAALLVPPGEEAALRATIQRALADAPLREKLGARARAIASAYDWDIVGERLFGALCAL